MVIPPCEWNNQSFYLICFQNIIFWIEIVVGTCINESNVSRRVSSRSRIFHLIMRTRHHSQVKDESGSLNMEELLPETKPTVLQNITKSAGHLLWQVKGHKYSVPVWSNTCYIWLYINHLTNTQSHPVIH